MQPVQIVCFGEVLWDILPQEKMPGGAPMNVALHLHSLDIPSAIISRTGDDELGAELRSYLELRMVPTDWIQVDPRQPTGKVIADLSDRDEVHYEIAKPVAWDYIEASPEAVRLVEQADALVYGSLACRTPTSRNTLMALLEKAAWKVFDVNLRKPHFEKAVLVDLLERSDLVKMNEEELNHIAGWYSSASAMEEQLSVLRDHFQLDALLVTRGKAGSAYFDGQGVLHQQAYAVTVEDTIGSGDAFLAGFLSRRIQGADPGESLAFASATGALVASRIGGTPLINTGEIKALMARNLSDL